MDRRFPSALNKLQDSRSKWRWLACCLMVMVAILVFVPCTEAQDDTLRCTDGTIVIYIKKPGMCPAGFYPL